jgi:GNAT superfamily N-acetyltransferase
LSPAPKTLPGLFAHQPSPRNDGRLPVRITYLALSEADWTRRGLKPDLDVTIEAVAAPTVALYRELYDRVGRAWLWYERRLLSDEALAAILAAPGHEFHVARHDGELVGYFEFQDDFERQDDRQDCEIVFFGLTLDYIGRRIGPWLLDRAIERALARGAARVILNTNTLDHPKALETYRKAGFLPVRSETRELQDPRVLWPKVYRWPPA